MNFKLQEDARLHGFTIVKAEKIDEFAAELVTMIHDKTAMPLYYLDRRDRNMTFAIGFRTAPTSDNGIFHILEHSVLCGSEHYPVKDPFSEMLKSSASTYLNALTYPERTVYPVSSKNRKAFLDLVGVYLDAVLHPLALREKNIFLQEGHRLELCGSDEAKHTGVVYNEMQGALSSLDDYIDLYIDRAMFEGGTYSYDSGGTPDGIATLRYSDFIAAHNRYYHPTNAFAFLDGDIDTGATLALIDGYLSEYDRGCLHDEIRRGRIADDRNITGSHPDVPDGKCEIAICRDLGTHATKNELFALDVIEDALCDSDSSPIKERMLGSGLCDDVAIYVNASGKYPTFNIRLSGVDISDRDAAIAELDECLNDIIKSGIDTDALNASLNVFEFRSRESDCGTFPKGVVLMSVITEAIVQGDDPADALRYNDSIAAAREAVGTSYYTDLLAAVLAADPVTMTVCHAESIEAASATVKITRDAAKNIERESAALALWQSTPDTEEERATLPILSRQDLDPHIDNIPSRLMNIDGAKVVFHPLNTEGISYIELYFDCSDIPTEHIGALSLMTAVHRETHTAEHTSYELSKLVKKHLGSFCISTAALKNGNECRLYLTVKASCLEREKANAAALLAEMLTSANLDDKERIQTVIDRAVLGIPSRLGSSAHRYAINRAAARYDMLDAVKEYTSGIEYLKYLRHIADDKAAADGIGSLLSDIAKRCICKERLTLCMTGDEDEAFARDILSRLPHGEQSARACQVLPLPMRDEYFSVSSPVHFAATMTNFKQKTGEKYHGGFSAVSAIMSLELLWNKIRVEGGAYDTGFIARANSGGLGYYSYRDPSPLSSLETFRHAAGMLKEQVESGKLDLERYVVGAVASADTVTTPRTDGSLENINILSGIGYEERVSYLRQLVELTPEQLYHLADITERSMAQSSSCILGDRDALISMGIKSEDIVTV